MIRWIGDREAPLILYVVRAALLSAVPSFAIAAALFFVLPEAVLAQADAIADPGPSNLLVEAFGYVVFAPVVETAGMALLFVLLRWLHVPAWGQVAVQVVVWSVLHALIAPIWGVTVAWSFLVFSLVYLAQERRSGIHAFIATTLVHAVQNAVATSLMYLPL